MLMYFVKREILSNIEAYVYLIEDFDNQLKNYYCHFILLFRVY